MPFETPPVRPKNPWATPRVFWRFDARRTSSMSKPCRWWRIGRHDREHLEQFAHLVGRDQTIEVEIRRWPAVGRPAALQGVGPLENSQIDQEFALSDWTVG